MDLNRSTEDERRNGGGVVIAGRRHDDQVETLSTSIDRGLDRLAEFTKSIADKGRALVESLDD